MRASTLAPVLKQMVHRQASDTDLLEVFQTQRDESAFAEIVHRYGRLVFGTCQRLLHHYQDTEDAFQAVFLIFLRKVHTLKRTDRLAGWLHTVAIRTAREIRSMRSRQQRTQSEVPLEEAGVCDPAYSADQLAMLDAEIAKLPETYRLPVLLCELQGKSRKEVARQLGLAEGTLSSRLAEARKRLAKALSKRGIGATTLAAMWLQLAQATVPGDVLQKTTQWIQGSAITTSPVMAITNQVIKGMFLTKLKSVMQILIVVTASLGSWVYWPESELRVTAHVHVSENAKQPPRDASTPAILKSTIHDRQNPIWKRFAAIAGDTATSRQLFEQMIQEESLVDVLVQAESDPKTIPLLVVQERSRMSQAWEQATKPFQKKGVSQEVIQELRRASRQAIPLSQLTMTLFLECYPNPERGDSPAKVSSGYGLLTATFLSGVNGEYREPFRRIFVYWLNQQQNPDAIRAGLQTALFAPIQEVLPLARQLIRDPNQPVLIQKNAFLLLGNYGTAEDIAILKTYRHDQRVVRGIRISDDKREVQVRDYATAMILKLMGQDIREYGFRPLQFQMWEIADTTAPFVGVDDIPESNRDAIHQKAWCWLEGQ